MRHAWHRVGGICALAVLALLSSSCAETGEAASGSATSTSADALGPEPVGGIVAQIGTNRLYAVDRAFGLVLQNLGREPVGVREVQLTSRRFAVLPPTAREVTLQPGGKRLVVPLPYGSAARCDEEPADTFEVVLVIDRGEELRIEAPEEFAGAVGRLHHRECAAAEVLERVEVTFGKVWTRDGVAISGELILDQRGPGEPVAIDDAVGNVIFTLRPSQAHPVLRVSDGARTDRIPVTISADRCDPHAVAEFKRPFVFLSWIAIGDADPVPVELEPAGEARSALEALLASCSS